MKNTNRIKKYVLKLFVLTSFLAACDIGLGGMINTEKPVISYPEGAHGSLQPGGYLHGKDNSVEFKVEQPFGVASAFLTVWYIDNDPLSLNYGLTVTKEFFAAQKSAKKNIWITNIDTTGMKDGKIRAKLTAVDKSGKTSTTTEITYYVKNTPAQIEMTIPYIKGDDFINENFDIEPVIVGFDLTGLATDDYGIKSGFPKIMIWSANYENLLDEDGFYIETNPDKPVWNVWRSMIVSNNEEWARTAKFTFPMIEKDGTRLPRGKYRFIMWIKDRFGDDHYYPNMTNNLNEWKNNKIKWIEINHMVSEIPIALIDEVPAFYNGIGDFNAKIIVSSAAPLQSVKVIFANSSSLSSADLSDEIDLQITNAQKENDIYTFNAAFNLNDNVYKNNVYSLNNFPSPVGSGAIFIHVIAKDINAKSNPGTWKSFTYDTTPPEINFLRPYNTQNPPLPPVASQTGNLGNGIHYVTYYPSSDNPRWVTGETEIGGSAVDVTANAFLISPNNPNGRIPSSGISKVYYHIGNLFDEGSPAEDRIKLYTNENIWIDTKLEENFPSNNWNGNVNSWTYTFNYNQYAKENPRLVQSAKDINLYDSLDPNNEKDKTGTSGRDRFYLPFYVKSEDKAGNIMVVHYKLCIDPDMDIPSAYIDYPEQNELIGGEVRLSGTASDNQFIHTVLIRIKKENENGYYIPKTSSAFYPRKDFPVPANNDTAGWFEAKKTGNGAVVRWFYNINGDNGLDPAALETQVNVKIEVRAIDSDHGERPERIGPAETVNVRFSSGVPTITTPVISKNGSENRNYFHGIRTSGVIKVSMIISDDDGFSNVRARIGSKSGYTTIIANNAIISSLPSGWYIEKLSGAEIQDKSRPQSYKLEFDINTASFAPMTGNLVLEIQADDSSSPSFSTKNEYNFDIDNFYPFTSITTQSAGLGNSFILSGLAQDYSNSSGNIQGLERVLIYFEEAEIHYSGSINGNKTVKGKGKFLNPRGKTLNERDTFYSNEWANIPAMTSYQNVKEGSTGKITANFENFPLLKEIKRDANNTVWESPHAMVVDTPENGELTDADNDGSFGEVWSGGIDKDWQVRLNTIYFKSGPLLVHYIVMDTAGNATHYSKPVYIENKRPVIASINVGTDINGDGIVTAANPNEFRSSPAYIDNTLIVGNTQAKNNAIAFSPTFRARNSRLAFNITTQEGTGNNGKNYKILHITENGSEKVIPFVLTGTGDSVTLTVSDFKDITNSKSVDDKLFAIKVYDRTVENVFVNNTLTAAPEKDQLSHEIYLKITVDNVDDVKPSVNIAQFGKKYILKNQDNLFGNPSIANDANKTEGNVSNYNENILPKQGYVQYKGDSVSGLADISGIVKFLGKAADNQRIKSISVSIPNYSGDADGDAFTVAEWKNGSLQPVRSESDGIGEGSKAWYFKITDSYLTLDYGHVINWEFVWDTSSVTNQTAKNLNIKFTINDHSVSGNSVSDDIKVNIAPYITDIVTSLSRAYTSAPSAFARSANGWYPARENETITIKGFNFGSNDGTTIVKINETSNFIRHTGSEIPLELPSSNYRVINKNEIRINVGTTAVSGALEVRVGSSNDSLRTPSLNNIRKTSAKIPEYNMEPNNVNNNTLTNARNVYIWSTGFLINDELMTSPVMRIHSDGTRYITYGRYTNTGILRLVPNNTGINDKDGTFNAAHSTAANTGNIEGAGSQNRYINNALAVDARGYPYVATTSTTAVTTSGFTFLSRPASASATSHYGAHASNNTSKTRIMQTGGDTNRFKYANISTQVTNPNETSNNYPTRIFMSHYLGTGNNNPVLFYYINIGAASTNIGGSLSGNTSNDSSTNIHSGAKVIVDNSNDVLVEGREVRGGRFTAAGGLKNGLPVVVWYDDTNNRLMLAHPGTIPASPNSTQTNYYSDANRSNVNAHTTADHWKENYTKIADNAGTHVSMAVDGNDNIHLAYYDTFNGGLHYAFIPATTISTGRQLNGTNTPSNNVTITVPDVSKAKFAKVDTFLSAGTNITLNVREENSIFVPYITYFHGAFTETRNSIRVAWAKVDISRTPQSDLQGTDSNDLFTGAWEVMTVPAGTVPVSNEYICNGVPSPANTSDSWIDPPANSTLRLRNTDLQKTIIVGYMTQNWYEGAILKK